MKILKLLALLTIGAGFFLVFNPLAGAVTLTLLLGFLVLLSGTSEIFTAIEMRPAKGWGWLLFAASISVIAGMLIIGGWPAGSLVLLGLILGIKFLAAGLAQLLLAFTITK